MNEIIKNNIGAICTASVSIVAMIITATVTIYNQRRQFKIQTKITIDKEWVEKVRSYTATCISNCYEIAVYNKAKSQNVLFINNESYFEAKKQFEQSIASIGVYLDFDNPVQSEFYEQLYALMKDCVEGKADDIADKARIVRRKAQKVFIDKLG